MQHDDSANTEMDVDPTAEELQTPSAVKAAGTPTVTTTTSGGTNVMTGRRFVLKRRLQNGAATTTPSNSTTTNGGNAGESSNGSQLMPQLVSTPSLTSSSTASATLLSNRVSTVGSGGLKIRKIDP